MRYVAAALVLLQAVSGRAQNSGDLNGTWTAELRAARVFLQLRTTSPSGGDSSYGETLPADEFGGLPVSDDRFTASSITFELRREAGVFVMDGAFRDGRGAGLFTFTPRAAFAAEMRAFGYTEELPPWRQYQLAVHDVGPKYLEALRAEGYDKLPLDIVQRARTHGVTAEYIRDLKAQGIRDVPMDTMIRTRDHGVRPEYVAELKQEGYTNVSAEDLVRMRDHGVTRDYIADMKELGLKDLTVSLLIRLHDHGITPGFVNHVRARGYKDADADELIRLKNRGTWN